MLPSQIPIDYDAFICLHAERNMSAAAIAAEHNLPLAHVQSVLNSDQARELIPILQRLEALRAGLRAAEDRRLALLRTLEIAQDRTNEALALRACLALLRGQPLPDSTPRRRAPRTRRPRAPKAAASAGSSAQRAEGLLPVVGRDFEPHHRSPATLPGTPEGCRSAEPQSTAATSPASRVEISNLNFEMSALRAPSRGLSVQPADDLLPVSERNERDSTPRPRSLAIPPGTPEQSRNAEPRLPRPVLEESSAPRAPASRFAPASPAVPRRHSRSRWCQPAVALYPRIHAHRLAFPHIRARDAPPPARAA